MKIKHECISDFNGYMPCDKGMKCDRCTMKDADGNWLVIILRVVSDGRVLKGICNNMGFEFDKEFKYITKDNNYMGKFVYKGRTYKLKYFDGCFYPYIVEVIE